MNINILKRWNEQYLRLSSFNRKARRTLKKRWKKSLLVIALALALGVSDASAATITVGETELGTGAVTIEDDGICSITEAIQNANNTSGNPVNVDCVAGGIPDGAGGAADDIILPNNSTFTFDGINPSTFPGNGQNALPSISSNITIEGNGSVLERMEDPLPPGAPVPDFRIINTNGNLTLNNLTLRNGISNAGGCVMVNGTFTLNNSEISGCNATNSGGGIYIFEGDAVIRNSIISGNSSGNIGGGIDVYSPFGSSNFRLINSTLSGNTSNIGGGVSIYYADSNIVNSTITNNTANNGGGLYLSNDSNIRNSIISGNQMTNGNVDNCEISIISNLYDLGNNLSNDSSCGLSISNFDNDCLGPLADNGGLTFTHALIASGDQQCSTNTAIDGGNNNTCANNPNINNLDQRGVMRPIDGDNDNIAVCDIGSFEFEPPPEFGMCSMAEIPGDGVDNNGDGDGTMQ